MTKYVAKVDTWLSHECRKVKAGEVFETEFPKGPGDAPMKLGENLALAEPEKQEKSKAEK